MFTCVSSAPIGSSAMPLTETMTVNGQKARYGLSYLRNICAQAGIGMAETSPDEDVLAVDCEVQFAEASVRVQVKCTSTLTISGRSKSWALEQGWIDNWRESRVPVYFVIVIVPSSSSAWLEHPDDGTMHRTAAFWTRINRDSDLSSITIPKGQRLSAGTLGIWHQDLLAEFASGGAA
jgi:hypothetical protein